MNRTLLCLSSFALVSAAYSQSSGTIVYQNALKTLNDAKTLKISYTSQLLGGAPASYTIEFAKPNKARIETPSQVFVADGTTVVTYNKSQKTFFKEPQNAKSLAKLLAAGETRLWAPFFDAKLALKPLSIKSKGTVNRKGMKLSEIEVSYQGKNPSVASHYINPADSLAWQVSIATKMPKGTETILVDAKTIELNGKIDDARYAFKAPDGSRELTAAEMDAGKWYTDYNEALAAAKATNRLVLIDFYTGWCHWCKVLREEVFPKDEFKAMSKYFVFCEIDAEAEPNLAAKYMVSAYPTSVMVDGNGTLVHQLVGYKPLDGYVAELETARQKAGLADR